MWCVVDILFPCFHGLYMYDIVQCICRCVCVCVGQIVVLCVLASYVEFLSVGFTYFSSAVFCFCVNKCAFPPIRFLFLSLSLSLSFPSLHFSLLTPSPLHTQLHSNRATVYHQIRLEDTEIERKCSISKYRPMLRISGELVL